MTEELRTYFATTTRMSDQPPTSIPRKQYQMMRDAGAFGDDAVR